MQRRAGDINNQSAMRSDAAPPAAAAFVAVAALLFGWLASYSFGRPITVNLPNADIWQHLAAIGALIDDPVSPANPFVATGESSRLFGPYWWIMAVVARAAGLTPLQAYGLGAAVNLALLALGIWCFRSEERRVGKE